MRSSQALSGTFCDKPRLKRNSRASCRSKPSFHSLPTKGRLETVPFAFLRFPSFLLHASKCTPAHFPERKFLVFSCRDKKGRAVTSKRAAYRKLQKSAGRVELRRDGICRNSTQYFGSKLSPQLERHLFPIQRNKSAFVKLSLTASRVRPHTVVTAFSRPRLTDVIEREHGIQILQVIATDHFSDQEAVPFGLLRNALHHEDVTDLGLHLRAKESFGEVAKGCGLPQERLEARPDRWRTA